MSLAFSARKASVASSGKAHLVQMSLRKGTVQAKCCVLRQRHDGKHFAAYLWPLLRCILLMLKLRLGEGALLRRTVTLGQVTFQRTAGGAVLDQHAPWPSTTSKTFFSVSTISCTPITDTLPCPLHPITDTRGTMLSILYAEECNRNWACA